MPLDTTNPRSRRALLAAAVGAAVATVASAVARPGPASATDNGDRRGAQELPDHRQGPDLPDQGGLDQLEHVCRLVHRGVLIPASRPSARSRLAGQ